MKIEDVNSIEDLEKTYKSQIREVLIEFCDSIKDYERESHNLVGHDERESAEFVDIFLKERE